MVVIECLTLHLDRQRRTRCEGTGFDIDQIAVEFRPWKPPIFQCPPDPIRNPAS